MKVLLNNSLPCMKPLPQFIRRKSILRGHPNNKQRLYDAFHFQPAFTAHIVEGTV